MYITAQSPRLRNDLYCVEWDVKLYHTIPHQTRGLFLIVTILRDHSYTATSLILDRVDCWALAVVWTLLSAVLVRDKTHVLHNAPGNIVDVAGLLRASNRQQTST